MNLSSARPRDNDPQIGRSNGGQPQNRPTPTELGALIEAVIIDDDELIWPVLAVLERVHLTAGRLPVKARQTVLAELNRAREALLFDRRIMAAAIAIAVERRLAAEEIVAGSRS